MLQLLAAFPHIPPALSPDIDIIVVPSMSYVIIPIFPLLEQSVMLQSVALGPHIPPQLFPSIAPVLLHPVIVTFP